MSTTVYLVVHDMSGVMSDTVIGMINYRCNSTKGIDHVDFESGTTYQELRDRYETYKPVKGAGGDRVKHGETHWVLPFWYVDGMPNPNPLYAVTLTSLELREFGWDEVEEEV
jgi:hypothetical protein